MDKSEDLSSRGCPRHGREKVDCLTIDTGVFFIKGFMRDITAFQTEECSFSPNVTKVYFENEYIGEVEYDDMQGGFLVFPVFSAYSGFFKSRESAIIELVFHYYTQTGREVVNC